MKKVLVATGLYPPDIGGPATYARMLEDELSKNDIEVEVLPFGSVRHLPKGIRHIAFARRLWCRANTIDIIYALDPISVGLPAWLVAKLKRKPFLIRLGGDYAWEQGRVRFGITKTLDEYTTDKKTTRPFRVRILAWLQTFIVRRAHYVILPSEYLKSVVATWGIKEDKLMVIYSALFPLPVSESRDTIRQKLDYTYPTLITAARLTPWKGIDTVISMVKELKSEFPDLTLVVAGDGEFKKTLYEKACSLGVEDSVRFVGRLSKEALGAAIRGADAFVYNTSYEGLPHQLLEVMDLGVPIVTTNIPGNCEIITDGVEGLLVSPDNLEELTMATKRLLQNQELQNRVTQNARARTKDFKQEEVALQLSELMKTKVCM